MKLFRWILIAFTIGGVIGCQGGSTTIAEYRPRLSPTVKKAPDSQVFELVRWTPIASVSQPTVQTTEMHRDPARQFAVEVEQVYADRGAPLGFRRNNAKLIAIAGETTKPLDEAHYEWRTMPGMPNARQVSTQQRIDQAWDAIGLVTIGAIVAGLIFLAIHDNRHDVVNAVN